ncbi:MAG TPA: hypothetical protein VKU82_10180 [Planctomycetaceae bacterium]|nr:hypothetical protein [Planctomycetaceae bacterium]
MDRGEKTVRLPMPGDYEQVLDDLKTGIDERKRLEGELAAHDSADDGLPACQLERRLLTLENECRQALEAAGEQHAAARQALEDRYRAAVAVIRGEYCRVAGQIENRFDEEMAKAENKYQENCWLVSSILDDTSESSPQWQFERLQTQLAQSRERLAGERARVKSICAQALALLADRRQKIGAEPEPCAAARNRDEAFQGFTSSARLVRESYERLSRQALPRVLAGWGLAAAGLFLWLGLFAGAWFLADPAWLGLTRHNSAEWALMTGGASFLLACVALLLAHDLAARAAHHAFEPLQQGAVDAESFFESWLEFADCDLECAERETRIRQAAIVERRDRSLEQFAAARDAAALALEQRRRREFREAAHSREAALREAAGRHRAQLQTIEHAGAGGIAALQNRFHDERARVMANDRQNSSEHSAVRNMLVERLVAEWSATVRRFTSASQALGEKSRLHFYDWDEIAEPAWQGAKCIPPLVRIGDYEVQVPGPVQTARNNGMPIPESAAIRLPAVLPFPGPGALLVKAGGEANAQAVSILKLAMLRLLTHLPPGDVRFTVIDAVGLGENFAAFMHLADSDELLISNRIWTEAAHIEQQLANLTEHMESVFQKYLRSDFETIEEYNEPAKLPSPIAFWSWQIFRRVSASARHKGWRALPAAVRSAECTRSSASMGAISCRAGSTWPSSKQALRRWNGVTGVS